MKRRLNLMTAAAVLGAGLFLTRQIVRSMRLISFTNRVVLISGGSRGLGLVMARRLATEGARLALLARHEDKLEEAREQIAGIGAEVFVIPCDISNKEQVDLAVKAVLQHYGRIDVLINDAGIIEVGPIETMTVDDYKQAMDTHFWGPLHLTMAVLPAMRQSKFGRIVNITSIGGKISVPHLLPYCASKYAHVGLSEGLRAELLKENILVTTVCPGMMRTGSHVNAYFKGHNKQEFAWFAMSNAMPLLSISAEQAARQVIQACRRGDAELIISLPAQLAIRMNELFPGVTEDLLGLVNRVLPKPNGHGDARFAGKDSRSWLAPPFMTFLSDKEIGHNNEN